MPSGRNCRSCGAPLPQDLSWCTTCYARVTPFAARPETPRGDAEQEPVVNPLSDSTVRESRSPDWCTHPTSRAGEGLLDRDYPGVEISWADG